jgi:hypothetical protein
MLNEKRKKALAAEFGLNYGEEEISNVEWAIMDKLSDIYTELQTHGE